MGKAAKNKQREAEKQEDIFRARFAQLSRQACTKPAVDPLVKEFEAYEKYFVRSPESFNLRTRSSNRSKQVLEMARHLFGRFRVPRILEQSWAVYLKEREHGRALLTNRASKNRNYTFINFRDWFVCVATGGSLYKTYTQGFLTKKETHAFLCAPDSLDLCQAVIYAVARSAGAKDGEAQRLARSKISEQPFNDYWFNAVRFFCLPDSMPSTLHVVNDLVDFLHARRQEDPNFKLLGSSQSLQAILRRMEQWHRHLARAKDLSGITWDGFSLPDYTIEQKDPKNSNLVIQWNFHQITTGKELAAEGSAQRHCVFGYKSRCVNGDCSIWSLTRTEQFGSKVRRLTIEVNKFGSIVQKRGLANRLPRPEEEAMVARWAFAHNLTNHRS